MTYSQNLETGKLELSFEYNAYKALDPAIKSDLKRYYRWNRYQKKWISKSAGKTTLLGPAIAIAEKAGLTKAQDIGEKMTFKEKMEKQERQQESSKAYFSKKGEVEIEEGKGFSEAVNRDYNAWRVFSKDKDLNEVLKDYEADAKRRIEELTGKPFAEASDYLISAYNRYRQAVIDYFQKDAATNAYAPNPFATGRSGYPVHRLEKADNRRRNNHERFMTAQERFSRSLENVKSAFEGDEIDPGFAMRRVKEAQKDRRAAERALQKLMSSFSEDNPRHAAYKEELEFKIQDANEKEEWYSSKIQQVEDEGKEVIREETAQEKYKGSTHVKYMGGWLPIVKLNPTTVTVDDFTYEGQKFKLGYDKIQDFATFEGAFRGNRQRVIQPGHHFFYLHGKEKEHAIYKFESYDRKEKSFHLLRVYVRSPQLDVDKFFNISLLTEAEDPEGLFRGKDQSLKVTRAWIDKRIKYIYRIRNGDGLDRFPAIPADQEIISRYIGGRKIKLQSLSGIYTLGTISSVKQEGYQECSDGKWSNAASGACAWHGGLKHRVRTYRRTVGTSCFAVMMPIEEIHTDEDRFQNRDKAYSEDSVQRIIQGFNIDKFDPIKVWGDPTSGLIYVLSGHSRLAAMKRMKKPDIPVRFFQGSEEEAIFFARLEANRLGTEETLKETLKIYIELRDKQGYDKTRLKEAFSNAKYALPSLEAYSHLSQRGKFLEILSTSAQKNFPLIENKAKWTGDLRRFHPSLRDTHENEIFDYLFTHPQGSKLRKDDFLAFIDPIINRLDFDPDKPLNLEKSNQRGVYARSDTREEMKRLKALEKEIQENAQLIRAARTQEEKAERRSLQQRLLTEKEQLERNINLITKTQASLFGLGLLIS
ncbi:MAG: ParB/RepB/Spo0J family partition protein [Bacteroidota bacterium]